jgi:uncharacterized protein (DUF983 family)
MGTFLKLFTRGLLLRCPVCGEGRLFRSPYKMNEKCPHCGFVFEREVGYFSSSMAINLVISELLIAAFTVPLALMMPLWQLFLWGAPVAILLPFIFYHHSRSLWMSMDHFLNPPQRSDWSPKNT